MTTFPPQGPDPEEAGPQRSAGVTAIGIISIVLGSIGLFCCAGMGFVGVIAANQPNSTIQLSGWDQVVPLINLLLAGALIVSGVATLYRKPWARPLAYLFAIGMFIVVIGNLLFSAATGSPPQGSPEFQRGYEIGEQVGKYVGAGVSLIYPAVLLWFYSRENVKAELTDGRGDAGGPGPSQPVI